MVSFYNPPLCVLPTASVDLSLPWGRMGKMGSAADSLPSLLK